MVHREPSFSQALISNVLSELPSEQEWTVVHLITVIEFFAVDWGRAEEACMTNQYVKSAFTKRKI